MHFGARMGGVARGLGGGVLGEGVVVELDEVVVVGFGWKALDEEVEGIDGEDAEAEKTNVGDAGAGCLVLSARRVSSRVRGCVCALSLVSCVRAGAGAVRCVMCGA